MSVNGHTDMQVNKYNICVFKLLLFYIFMIGLIIRFLSIYYSLSIKSLM